MSGDIQVCLEEVDCILPALPYLLTHVRVPGTTLVKQFIFERSIENTPVVAYPFAEEHVEFNFLERWSNLVLHDLYSYPVSDDIVGTSAYCFYAANLDSDRGVELECITTGGRLRVTEHDIDLHTNLVYENDGRIAF